MYLGDVEQVRQRFERVGAAAGCCDDVGESGGTLVPSLPINDGAYHQPAVGTHIGELADTGGFVTNGAAVLAYLALDDDRGRRAGKQEVGARRDPKNRSRSRGRLWHLVGFGGTGAVRTRRVWRWGVSSSASPLTSE